MEKITGREAITTRAEYDNKKRKLTENELRYVNTQVCSFRNWLIKKGLSLHEANEQCIYLYEQDVLLVTEEDPYAEFIWSKGQEVGDMEIDSAMAITNDPVKQLNGEFFAHRSYWERMEMTADKASTGYLPEYWKKSEEKQEEIMNFFMKLFHRFNGKIMGPRDNVFLAKVNRRLDALRFGNATKVNGIKYVRGGGELVYRHWAEAKNFLNEIRGISKRFVLKELEDKTQDSGEYIDAMDNAVYSIDRSRRYEE